MLKPTDAQPKPARQMSARPASGTDDPSTTAKFREDLARLMPFLRAFSRSLCIGDKEMADDLAQEALTKAWRARNSFAPGTNLKAWLFTILRNEFYSCKRRGWRQQPWDQEAAERIPDGGKDQMSESDLSDTMRAMRSLSDEHRVALVLVAAGGLSYAQAAPICGCEVGTVKSRVSRARKRLLEILDGQSFEGLAKRTIDNPVRDLETQYERLVAPHGVEPTEGVPCD